MFSLDVLLVPIAALALGLSDHEASLPLAWLGPAQEVQFRRGFAEPCAEGVPSIAEAHRPERARQMRIEQRVIVRIAPLPAARRGTDRLDVPTAQPSAPRRFEERRAVKCIAIRDIGGVSQTSDDRLVLFMRSDTLVSARLDRGCRARDFYSGFYLEHAEDGMLCSGRDMLHSRAGSKCTLSRLHRLAPVDD